MKQFIKKIQSEGLLNINFDQYKKYDLSIYNEYLYLEAGKEHYQLLANISNNFNNKVFFDVGTNYGASAIALGHNKSNKVISYDIIDLLPTKINEENIEFVIGDVLKDERLITSDFIFLDTMHDGAFEKVFLDFLIEKKYSGVVALDDVDEYPILRSIAENICKLNNFELIDLTHIGHFTGTLVINFN